MIEGRPSMTARRVAMRRAAHQMIDRPLVFEDPLAVPILGPEIAATLEVESAGLAESRLRAFIVVRSRYAEEQLRMAVSNGVRQYVLLGAGLDTFAYRNPFPDLQVFEVDYPATQAWKRRCLHSASIAVPASLRFIPVDFEKESWKEGLCAAGFAGNEPAFFAWLGVTFYLAEDVVWSTLRLIRSLCAANSVVMDYMLPRELLNKDDLAEHDALAKRVTKAGEPLRGLFEPRNIRRELRNIGYESVEDLGSADLNARFFSGRTDGLCVCGELAHLLCAMGGRRK